MNNYLKKQLQSDTFRYTGSTKLLSSIKMRLKFPTLYYLTLFRKAHYYHKTNRILSLFFRYRLHNAMLKYQIQIPYYNKLGLGICIQHIGRVIIAGNVTLGNNIDIFTGVTIGREFRGIRDGVPTIGNNVWIGPNSVVVGKIIVGDNVLIAPNAFCNFDVPSNSIVIGNPGRIIPRIDATQSYLLFKYLDDDKNE